MKDLPIFTGCCGIATLILHEIPYRKEAYVLVRSVFTTPEEFMEECESFCRAAGADRIYYGGKGDFASCSVYASLMERSVPLKSLPSTDAVASAAASEEEETWLSFYRKRFAAVPAATGCPSMDGIYFIRQGGEIIGLGQVKDSEICAVASLKPHAGADCVCALAACCSGETITLLCAEQNEPAMKLYDSLGFSRGRIKEVWFCKKGLAF